jgi:hypothetical protein
MKLSWINAVSFLMSIMTNSHSCEQIAKTPIKQEPAKTGNGFWLFGSKFFSNESAAAGGHLVEVAIGVTIFLVVVGYVLAPVGLQSIGSVNRTAAGVAAGTTSGNIWDAFVPIIMATLVLAVIYTIKQKG